jgi:hypothetical protein
MADAKQEARIAQMQREIDALKVDVKFLMELTEKLMKHIEVAQGGVMEAIEAAKVHIGEDLPYTPAKKPVRGPDVI